MSNKTKKILLAPIIFAKNIFFGILKGLLLFFVCLYKIFVSPLLPNTCPFYPTCSTYAMQAIKSFGPFVGVYLAAKRLLRCNGRNGGVDFIPDNIKKEFKHFV